MSQVNVWPSAASLARSSANFQKFASSHGFWGKRFIAVLVDAGTRELALAQQV
jgi:hypothetical protein